jgi:hypothetical protein
MKLGDLLPDTHFLTHPQDMFKSNNGKPFLQSVARNLGQASFGKEIAGKVNGMMGDQPAVAPSQNTFSTLMTNGTVPVNQTPGAITPVQPQLNAAPQQKANTGKGLLDIIQSLQTAQQGGM